MKVALVDVDGHNFPNLALMKLSAWHKANGDEVEWYDPLFSRPDRIYASKVFTYTPDYPYFPRFADITRGGTGYDATVSLPNDIESTLPDYTIYPQYKEAYGFLSRGCVRNCPWCVVPRKEGRIRAVSDVERIAQERRDVILMDNNFLANDPSFVEDQLGKAKRLGLRLDFNQALDARLVTDRNARLLAATRWINRRVRFACDTLGMINPCLDAMDLMRRSGFKGEFMVYVLARDVETALERIIKLADHDRLAVPFCQPFRDFSGKTEIDPDLARLARWCNRVEIRKTVKWDDYKR